MNHSLTAVPGIRVGHWTDLEAATGCTVILCPAGAVAGVDVRGGAPGTRETDLLNPICTVQQVHAICLTGGSAFGLAAADGVMQWLEEQGAGFDTRVARVPIVPAAVIFDLAMGKASVRPTAAAGYAACVAATAAPVAEGTIGAGTGATVGKMLGYQWAMKGGVGSASHTSANGITVAALAVVNAAGDIVDPQNGQIVAGARRPDGNGFADTMATLHRAGEVRTTPWDRHSPKPAPPKSRKWRTMGWRARSGPSTRWLTVMWSLRYRWANRLPIPGSLGHWRRMYWQRRWYGRYRRQRHCMGCR
jgi:L-aminopeptidase/D-esterase-like protein